jgi:hypothetical protein
MNTGLIVTRPSLRPSVQAWNLHFGEARVLEVRDGHRGVALLLGFDGVADQVARDAELGDRVRGRGRRRGGMEGGLEARLEDALEVRLDLRDVGRHVDLVGRALEPDLVHLFSTSATTRNGLPLPLRILSGAAITTDPVGGS